MENKLYVLVITILFLLLEVRGPKWMNELHYLEDKAFFPQLSEVIYVNW